MTSIGAILLLVGLGLAVCSCAMTALASSLDALYRRRVTHSLDGAAQGLLVAAFATVAATWLGSLVLPLLQVQA